MTENVKTLILHIGRHKTGTTSIQQFLDANASVMEPLGIVYPRFGRSFVGQNGEEAHHKLAKALADIPTPTCVANMRASLLAETEGFHTVVLSSEGFQNLGDLGPLKALLSGFNVIVVCYLRETLAYCASAYSQEVKGSATFSDFETFAAYFSLALHYPTFVASWKELNASLRLRLYDGADIVSDFLKTSGLATSLRYERPPALGVNPSISGAALGFKLLVNQFGLHTSDHVEVLDRLASERAEFRGPFSIRMSGVVRDLLASENNRLLRQLFGDLPTPRLSGHPIMPTSWRRDFADILEYYREPRWNRCNVRETLHHPAFATLTG